jgi:FAD/FMN-containing dehydrogenase
MARLEPLSKGIQLADENLVARPARFLSEENLARLEQLRAKYDPDGVFHSYLL